MKNKNDKEEYIFINFILLKIKRIYQKLFIF